MRGVDVKYAIHPVAGHMNELLDNANVPYEQLKEMNEINEEFKQDPSLTLRMTGEIAEDDRLYSSG